MPTTGHGEGLRVLGFDSEVSASGSRSRPNGDRDYTSSLGTELPAEVGQRSDTPQLRSAHDPKNRVPGTPPPDAIAPRIESYGTPDRSSSQRSKGKGRADHLPEQVPHSGTPDANKLFRSDQFKNAIEDEAVSRSQYPGPPPPEPPPLPPISPSHTRLSSTEIRETMSPFPAEHDSRRSEQRTHGLTDTNSQVGTTFSSQTESSGDLSTAQGSANGASTAISGRQVKQRPYVIADSPTSVKSSTRFKIRIPSREILQTALSLAQQAVKRDGDNDIPSAITLYREAVEKLRTVMGRVGLTLEPLSPELGISEPGEDKRADQIAGAGRRRAIEASRTAEEGKTLKGIHDAYVARIALLTQMRADGVIVSEPSAAMKSMQRPLAEGQSPHLASSQSLKHTISTESRREVHHGGNDAPITDHRYPDTNQLEGPLLGGVHIRRPDTIVTEARPPISQRTASLPAYQNSASSSSPSSPSFEHNDRLREQPEQIGEERDAAVESPSRSTFFSRLTMSTDQIVEPNSASNPVPSRATPSLLRLSPQPEHEINGNPNQYDDGLLTEVQQGSDERMNLDRRAVRNRRRTESDVTVKSPKATPTPSNLASPNLSPIVPAHYPFLVLRQIYSSMTTSHGALVTQGLHVPQTAWSVTGAKLPALDTKNRIMLLLSQSLTVVREAGQPFLQMEHSGQIVLDTTALSAFIVALDDLEALTGECQKILAKKVGDGKVLVKPRKPNTASISNWGSKFSKTFDKMMTVMDKSLDSNATYNECLMRLCADVQCIEHHLTALKDKSTYIDSRMALESRLRRISDFFGDVILRFVLQDLSLLLSRRIIESAQRLMDQA